MRVLFWSNLPHPRTSAFDELVALVEAPGAEILRAASVEDCLRELPKSDLLVLGDMPREIAQAVSPGIISSPQLRGLHFISAGRDGFDGIDFPARLTITDQDGATAPGVSEHGMAMLLGLVRQLPPIILNQHAGIWDRTFASELGSLEGRTALIVGLGHIGRAFARRLRAFGVSTVGLQRTPRADDSVDEVGVLSDLDARLPESDIVIITIALTPETHGLIGSRQIGLMRPTAILINSARGGIVDTDALAAALIEGRIGGAGLDVTEPEPLPAGHPLWSAPNAILSPHVGGGGGGLARLRIAAGISKRIQDLMAES